VRQDLLGDGTSCASGFKAASFAIASASPEPAAMMRTRIVDRTRGSSLATMVPTLQTEPPRK
jgi:hypothetical protein